MRKSASQTFAIAALLTLTGCATTRFVQTPCISKDQAIPSQPDKIHGKLTGKADEDTRILAGGLIRWEAYGIGLRTILEGCREK